MPLSVTRKEALESMQYLAATIVLHTKLNIPKLAVLLVLGREPLSTFFWSSNNFLLPRTFCTPWW